MNLYKLERLSEALEAALDEVVDESGHWRDVPLYYTDEILEAFKIPLRIECVCGFCEARFCPLGVVEEYEGKPYNTFHWCYYQAGYWFGNTGTGHHFPVCSDGCEAALARQLNKRMLHTRAEMAKVSRARRSIQECKTTIRRMKRAQRP